MTFTDTRKGGCMKKMRIVSIFTFNLMIHKLRPRIKPVCTWSNNTMMWCRVTFISHMWTTAYDGCLTPEFCCNTSGNGHVRDCGLTKTFWVDGFNQLRPLWNPPVGANGEQPCTHNTTAGTV